MCMTTTTAQAAALMDNERAVATKWYERTSVVAVGHYRAASRYTKLHYFLAVPAIVLSAIVGTAVFASLQQMPSLAWQVTVGLMSMAAAVFSLLQPTLGYLEKAEKHRVAGSKYNSVGRELELLLAQQSIDPKALDSVRIRVDSLAQESPHIPRAVHDEMGKFPDIDKWGK